jgi:hypothetical protein
MTKRERLEMTAASDGLRESAVLVMVEVNSRKDWKATRDSIAKIPTDIFLPMVAVEVVKDRINLLNRETGFKEEIMGAHVIPGGPISLPKKKTHPERLGSSLSLKTQRTIPGSHLHQNVSMLLIPTIRA